MLMLALLSHKIKLIHVLKCQTLRDDYVPESRNLYVFALKKLFNFEKAFFCFLTFFLFPSYAEPFSGPHSSLEIDLCISLFIVT